MSAGTVWRASLLHVDISSSSDEEEEQEAPAAATPRADARRLQSERPRARSVSADSSSDEEAGGSPATSGRTLPYSPGSPALLSSSPRSKSPLKARARARRIFESRQVSSSMQALLVTSHSEGGGVGRSALATGLQQLGFRVVMAEASKPQELMAATGRLFDTLTPGAAAVLAYMGPAIATGENRYTPSPPHFSCQYPNRHPATAHHGRAGP